MTRKSDPQTILIYSIAEISGDGLIKLPFLAGLRKAFPDARLTWCAASGSSVYGGWLAPVAMPLMDELLLSGPMGMSIGETLPWSRPFGGRRFDLVIDTQSNVRRSLAVRAGARRFISPCLGFVFSSKRPKSWPTALADRMRCLLQLAGGPEADLAPVSLSDQDLQGAARDLLPDGAVYVGFAPGAGGHERRWPLARYIELARRQRERGRVAVFILGPGEADYVPAVRDACPWALMPLQASTTLSEAKVPLLTMALASRLKAAVASDAGPGHILAAGGTSLVSLAIERRKAEKFRPATRHLTTLVAEEYGPAAIDSIPLEAVDQALEHWVQA